MTAMIVRALRASDALWKAVDAAAIAEGLAPTKFIRGVIAGYLGALSLSGDDHREYNLAVNVREGLGPAKVAMAEGEVLRRQHRVTVRRRWRHGCEPLITAEVKSAVGGTWRASPHAIGEQRCARDGDRLICGWQLGEAQGGVEALMQQAWEQL